MGLTDPGPNHCLFGFRVCTEPQYTLLLPSTQFYLLTVGMLISRTIYEAISEWSLSYVSCSVAIDVEAVGGTST